MRNTALLAIIILLSMFGTSALAADAKKPVEPPAPSYDEFRAGWKPVTVHTQYGIEIRARDARFFGWDVLDVTDESITLFGRVGGRLPLTIAGDLPALPLTWSGAPELGITRRHPDTIDVSADKGATWRTRIFDARTPAALARLQATAPKGAPEIVLAAEPSAPVIAELKRLAISQVHFDQNGPLAALNGLGSLRWVGWTVARTKLTKKNELPDADRAALGSLKKLEGLDLRIPRDSEQTYRALHRALVKGPVPLHVLRIQQYDTKGRHLYFGQLTALRRFSIADSPHLQHLEISGLPHLETLHLTRLREFRNCNASGLKRLRGIDVEDGHWRSWGSLNGKPPVERIRTTRVDIEHIPFQNLPRLRTLDVEGYSRSRSLFSSVRDCPELRRIHIRHAYETTIGKNKKYNPFKTATNLQTLSLNRCRLYDDRRLYPDAISAKTITELRVIDFPYGPEETIRSLEMIPEYLPKLRVLELGNVYNAKQLPILKKLTELEELTIHSSNKLKDIKSIGALTKLRTLSLDDYDSILGRTTVLPTLTKLTELKLSSFQSQKTLNAIATLTELRTLGIRRIPNVTSLQGLAKLAKLRTLTLANGDKVAGLQGIEGAVALRLLTLKHFPALTDVRALKTLSQLEKLDLHDVAALQTLDGAEGLSALVELSIRAPKLADITALKGTTRLRTLTITGSESLVDLAPLAKLPHLQTVLLDGSETLANVAPLTAVPNLQVLSLRHTPNLADVTPLVNATALQSLDLDHSGVTSVPPITSLRTLSLVNCSRIDDFRALAGLTSLRTLDLRFCPSVQMETLKALSGLRTLRLAGIQNIDELRARRADLETALPNCTIEW